MKQFVIEIEYDRHLVQARDEIVDCLETLYDKFNEWLSDKGNDHGYWVAIIGDPNDPSDSAYGVPRDPRGRDGVEFDENAFVKWLNENHNAAAEIVATERAREHYNREFFEWAKAKGYIDEESFMAELSGFAKRFGLEIAELSETNFWFDDKLYPIFVEETDFLPGILWLVEKHGVKQVYF